MQEGKGVHRGGGGLSNTLGSFAVMSILWLAVAADAAAADSSIPQGHAAMLADCPQGVASGNPFFGSGAGGRKRLGFHARVANPYMLDGLGSSDFLSGIENGSFSAWLSWRHLGHALYREDFLAAAMGFSCPFGAGLRLYAIPAIERREALGFDAEGSRMLSLAFSYEFRGSVSIGCAGLASGSAERGARNTRAFLLVRGGSLALAVDRAISGARGADAQFALEAWLGDACAFVSGYRWSTGEVSCGIVVRVSRAVLDFSWSRNPALGSTVAAGAGRMWEW